MHLGVAAQGQAGRGGVDGALDAEDAVAGKRQGAGIVAGLEEEHAGVRAGGHGRELEDAVAAEGDAAEVAAGAAIVDEHAVAGDVGAARDDEAAAGDDVDAGGHGQAGGAGDVDLAVDAGIDCFRTAADDHGDGLGGAARRCQSEKWIGHGTGAGMRRRIQDGAAGQVDAADHVDARRSDDRIVAGGER